MTTPRAKVIDQSLLVLICIRLDHRADLVKLQAFKAKVISAAEVSMETSGSFDFVVQLCFQNIIAFNDYLTAMASDFGQFASNYETSFVCKRHVRDNATEDCLWVPCASGQQRVDFGAIIKVKAERDYMRVHARDATWLLHTTLCKLNRTLDGRGFLHVHRSTIVNQQHVQRLLQHSRQWEVVLSDGSVEPVSKAHAAHTIRALGRCRSSNSDPVVEDVESDHRIVKANRK